MFKEKSMKKIELSKEIKGQLTDEIKKYFLKERDEEMGDLSAMMFLDFITENMGPVFYNQAVKDAHQFMSEKVEDLFGLEKRHR
jgi:uncharacterized protein (DUF2164 family)